MGRIALIDFAARNRTVAIPYLNCDNFALLIADENKNAKRPPICLDKN
jgi:hypothetical protein